VDHAAGARHPPGAGLTWATSTPSPAASPRRLAEAIVGKRPKRRVPTPFEPQPLEKTLEQRAKFLRDWRTTARLVTMGSHRNRSNATVLVPNGPLGS
jgi:hypothetical protein